MLRDNSGSFLPPNKRRTITRIIISSGAPTSINANCDGIIKASFITNDSMISYLQMRGVIWAVETQRGLLINVAQGYNCDAYGASEYGACQTQASGGGSSSGGENGAGGSSPLANTGVVVWGIIALACLLLLAGLILRIIRRKKST